MPGTRSERGGCPGAVQRSILNHGKEFLGHCQRGSTVAAAMVWVPRYSTLYQPLELRSNFSIWRLVIGAQHHILAGLILFEHKPNTLVPGSTRKIAEQRRQVSDEIMPTLYISDSEASISAVLCERSVPSASAPHRYRRWRLECLRLAWQLQPVSEIRINAPARLELINSSRRVLLQSSRPRRFCTTSLRKPNVTMRVLLNLYAGI